MPRLLAVGAVLACIAAGTCCGRLSSPAVSGRGPCQVAKEADVPATMRDGIVLRADVFRPQTDESVPVILMRTQYGKDDAQGPPRYETPDWFASHCYLVVIQDVRGQGDSAGTFNEFVNDQQDGYDSVEWAAALPGSNGRVGMYGSSYVGAIQWLAAVTAPPHLVTIVPTNTASDYYDGWTYEGGEFRLGFVLPWTMGIALSAAKNRHDDAAVAALTAAKADPTRWLKFRPYQDLPPLQPNSGQVAPYYFDWIRHWTRDGFWAPFSIRDQYPSVRVPVLDVEGWYDGFLAGGVQNFSGMVERGNDPRARSNQRLVIGPWDHVNWGRDSSQPAPILKDIGAVGNSPINELMIAWFDHFLKDRDNGISGRPRVDYFLMGANSWKSAPSWPLPQTIWTRYYLDGPGGLADRGGTLRTFPPPRRLGSRHLHVRPCQPGAEPGWALVLRRPDRPAGTLRSNCCRAALRRVGLQQRSVRRRHRGHGTDHRRAVGVVVGF